MKIVMLAFFYFTNPQTGMLESKQVQYQYKTMTECQAQLDRLMESPIAQRARFVGQCRELK